VNLAEAAQLSDNLLSFPGEVPEVVVFSEDKAVRFERIPFPRTTIPGFVPPWTNQRDILKRSSLDPIEVFQLEVRLK
jgi:hypothetical protein